MKTLKFLICDDSKLIRMKLSEILKKLENEEQTVELHEASDGVTAVNLFKEIKPDVVFLDITMPAKSGLEALEEMVSFDKDAKIIMASSVGTKEHLKRAIDLGAVDFIQKPLEEEKVLGIVKKILNLH
ncbi:MAG: response regulator [Fervidobacterium sp.]|nr:response regulator [Fervidobacterium sp.]